MSSFYFRRSTAAFVAGLMAAGIGVAAQAPAAAEVTPQAPVMAQMNDEMLDTSPLMLGAAAGSKTQVLAHEAALSHRLNGLRIYQPWDGTLNNSYTTWARDTGHTLFVSIRSQRRNGTVVPYNDIIAAQPGDPLYADMLRQAEEIKTFGEKIYIIYNHEPEASQANPMGSPSEFAAAWRKLVSVYREAGVTNAEYVLTMTAWGFKRKDDRNVRYYYPGDDYVDHIAADGYNWYRCRKSTGTWTELSQIIEAQRAFGAEHPDKGLMLMEWSTTEDVDQPGRKAEWIANAADLFTQPGYEQYNTILQWGGRNFSGNLACGFDYTTSESATQAFVDMAHNPSYSAVSLP